MSSYDEAHLQALFAIRDEVRWCKRLLYFIALAALVSGVTGCAATGSGAGTRIQAECEAKNYEFGAMFRCTRETIAAKHPEKLNDPKAKMYLLRGEQLALDSDSGKISGLEARVAWQKLYVELWPGPTPSEREAAANMWMNLGKQLQQQADQAPTYQIVRPPTTTNCTSRSVFGTVYTDCTSR